MIIYNVTISVDEDIHDEWLEWMRTVHIPDVMETGLFVGHRILKVLSDVDTGVTYSIQYDCHSMKELEEYHAAHAPRLQKDTQDRYGDKFVAFRTLLELL